MHDCEPAVIFRYIVKQPTGVILFLFEAMPLHYLWSKYSGGGGATWCKLKPCRGEMINKPAELSVGQLGRR